MPKPNRSQQAAYNYQPTIIDKGYNNRTLYVNLSDNRIEEKPVDRDMKETFIGGRGFGLRLLWNGTAPKTAWDDPNNELCLACGPLGGTTVAPGSGKTIAVTISPATGAPIDSNVGGYFGPFLKFSGFDAIELQGKADEDVVVVIDGDAKTVTIEKVTGLPEATHLLGQALGDLYGGADNLRSVCSVTAGPGAEHTLMGCLNFSYYDNPRKSYRFKQAGRGGTGTVLRDKKIKALVVKFSQMKADINHPADPAKLKEVGRAYSAEIRELDPKQNEMSVVGTTHLTPIMNAHDTLPNSNFRYGSNPEAEKLGREVYRKKFHPGYDGCWKGCTVACAHTIKDFELKTGPFAGQKVWVDGPEYETIAGCGSNWACYDPDFVSEVNFYCDTYGLDTISVGTSIAFVMECFELGLIDEKVTGGLEIKFGAQEAALEIVHQMARGEGFGAIVGQGVARMKKVFAEKYGADAAMMADIGMESKGLEFSEYMTKESLAQQGGYGLALKGPQHDEAWLIFLDAVHNLMPTFEQKAYNLYWFPMWRTWFGLMGLCKLPWNDIVPADNHKMEEPAKVVKHLQWYADYFSAVTGVPAEVDDLIKMSEKVYNFQRIFNLRQGFGRRAQDYLPYRAVGPVTEEEYLSRADRYDAQLKEQGLMDPAGKSTAEKMAVLRTYREGQYEKLKDAAYEKRGWTKDGVPTLAKVKELGIDYPDVVELISSYQ